MKLGSPGFLRLLITNLHSEFKMADAIWQTKIKKLLNLDKAWWRFSGSLIINLRKKLINLKWWIQYSGQK